ncbi:MAG: hypothetical protein ACMVO3_23145 [Thalassobaculum sp.]
MIADSVAVDFAPLVPWALVIALGALALLVLALGWIRRANGILWRTLALGALTLALANPTLIAEQREPRADVVVVAVDRTTSQSIGGREAQTEAAVAALEERLARLDGLSVKRVTVRDGGIGESTEGTRLGTAVRDALSDVPQGRVAGVIAVTDGQVHDADRLNGLTDAPLHVLLTGEQGERDRRLRVARAPSFGMVGKTVTLTVEVVDPATPRGEPVAVNLSIDGEPGPDVGVPANTEHEIEIPVDHAGQTIVELAVESGPAELTLENNRAVVGVSGVRDRLRVLLVSGAPHAGERTWRDILKSDPSVDLVHFTILRPPEKQDGTPIRELSLIAFPFRELFELKLAEFDLIIFDRYRRRGVLPRLYLRNIADYIRDGGALLEASGPDFRRPPQSGAHAARGGPAHRSDRRGDRAGLPAARDRYRPTPSGDQRPGRGECRQPDGPRLGALVPPDRRPGNPGQCGDERRRRAAAAGARPGRRRPGRPSSLRSYLAVESRLRGRRPPGRSPAPHRPLAHGGAGPGGRRSARDLPRSGHRVRAQDPWRQFPPGAGDGAGRVSDHGRAYALRARAGAR